MENANGELMRYGIKGKDNAENIRGGESDRRLMAIAYRWASVRCFVGRSAKKGPEVSGLRKSWCGRGDSNPYGIATASPSSLKPWTSIAAGPGKSGSAVFVGCGLRLFEVVESRASFRFLQCVGSLCRLLRPMMKNQELVGL